MGRSVPIADEIAMSPVWKRAKQRDIVSVRIPGIGCWELAGLTKSLLING